MSATAPAHPAKKQIAKVTSKGQITIPVELRETLGIKAGDRLVFERQANGEIFVRKVEESPTAGKIDPDRWLPPGYEGREGIVRYFRELRGRDEIDDLIFGTEP